MGGTNDKKLWEDEAVEKEGPVECLGMEFESDEARRECFLEKLEEGLLELEEKLGGIPFTSVDDAVERMTGVDKWPMGDKSGLRELARRMSQFEDGKDLLQRWKIQ